MAQIHKQDRNDDAGPRASCGYHSRRDELGGTGVENDGNHSYFSDGKTGRFLDNPGGKADT
ncbi:hypothetical protein D3C71_2147470 [compost metagenome]